MADADDGTLFIGARSGGEAAQALVLKRANRHGLIAGATGTGKTVTLQVLAEGFSRAGVPVFLSDVKGDLSGIALPGSPTAKTHAPFQERAADIGLGQYPYADTPAVFWDLFGEQGHPVRTTVSEMGPLLLARLLGLNDTQEGVLAIAFKVADDQNLMLLDLKDLKQMLAWCGDNARELATSYGNVTSASVGAIQRQLLSLESQGGDRFFGEPALAITDLIATAEDGRGQVNILAADKLMAAPKLYATFLLWMLSELFESLPEVGDPDKPKLVFFFDEAHLLFDEAPKALLDKVEQVVRLIRSKGVGVYFITQNPIDVPEAIAGQLGNRIQHALRAFTPRDQKAVKAAATTFRQNPAVNVETEITELKTGEALVSLLMADGAPSPVERVLIRPPASRVGPLDAAERTTMIASSPVAGKYDATVDRESAFELLSAKVRAAQQAEAAEKAEAEARKAEAQRLKDEAAAARAYKASPMGKMEKVAMATAAAVATQAGRSLVRGLLGGLFKKR
jgi:DNA helicase HerA-like ATPase